MSTLKKEKESSWVRVQEKAFTQWMHDTVQKRNMEVHDLRTDLEDGLKVINFFELLSGHKMIEKYDPRPSQKIQKINNLSIALRFLERDMGVRNPGCSAEDIFDASTKGIKLILGLLWTLFRKYRMKVDLGEGASRKGREEDMLLEWVRSVLSSHGQDASSVQSFKTSFNDGRIFLALTQIFDGDKKTIPFDEAKAKKPTEVLAAAFDYAEKHMSVNKLLDPEEVADGGMDERALALYTSLFYHAYKTKAELEKMQATLGQSTFQLELEHKNKDELIKMNFDLNESLTKAKAELVTAHEASEVSHRELVEARERIEELERLLAAKEAERLALKQAYADLEASRNAEIVKRQAAEEVVRTLSAQLEATHVLCEEERTAKEKALSQIAQLTSDLDKANERLRIETAAKEGGVRDLTEKLSSESQRVKELTDKHAAEVAHTEELSAEVADLKGKLRKEQKASAAREKQLGESREQTRLNTSGLAVLRTNLDSHISDLHRWQKFLEGRVADVEDPVEEIERVREELEKLSFQEQLNLLSSHLQEENVSMTRILRERAKEKEKGDKPAAASSADGTKEKKKRKHREKGEKAAGDISPASAPATSSATPITAEPAKTTEAAQP